MKIEAMDLVAEGDKVALRTTWSGKHTGSMMGETPTNKVVSGSGIEINVFADGKIKDRWTFGDEGKLMMELGIGVPPAS